jgi:hypothetical protein
MQHDLCTKIKLEDYDTRERLNKLVERKMYLPYYVPLVDPTL